MALGRKQREIQELQGELEDERQRSAELQGRLALEQTVNVVSDKVRSYLDRYKTSGLLEDQAMDEALVAVTAEETERIRGNLAEELRVTKYDELAASLRVEEGPRIKAELDDLFKSDGTYGRIKDDAREHVRIEVQAQLLTEAEDQVEAELSDPSVKVGIIEAEKQRLIDSGELDEHRSQVRQRLESSWQGEAVALAQQQILEEERAREAQFKAAYSREYIQGYHGQQLRENTRADLEREWKEKSIQEIAQALRDEELLGLLGKRAEQEKQRLAKETRAQELIEQFEGSGIDVEQLQAGSLMVIYLGGNLTKEKVNENYTDNRGYHQSREVIKSTQHYRRKLVLKALGESKFVVDGDSLHESSSSYERGYAIPVGTIIVVGRKVTENGVDSLRYRLVSGVPLYYDDDTSTPNIVNAMEPIANVNIDGVMARRVDAIKPI